MPRCTPIRTSGSRVSSTICLPRRRAAVNALPTSAWRSAGAVVPRFMNQVSGACTFAISRSSAHASSTLRAASTSRISGTAWSDQMLVIAPVLGALRERARTWRGSRSCSAARAASSSPCASRSPRRRRAGRSCARRRRSRCDRLRRRTRSDRRRRLRARRGRRRSRACRREKRPSVIERAVAAAPGALHRAGDREHLAHARPALRALVADDDDVAGLDLPGEDRRPSRGLRRRTRAPCLRSASGRGRRPSRPRPSARASRAGRRCRPARARGSTARARRRRRASGGARSSRFSAIVLPVTRQAVAVQQPRVEQLLHHDLHAADRGRGRSCGTCRAASCRRGAAPAHRCG